MAMKCMDADISSDEIARVSADDGEFFAEIVNELVVEYGLKIVVEEELKTPSKGNWLDEFLGGLGEGGRAFIEVLATAIDQEAG